jgi:hypothetical protein
MKLIESKTLGTAAASIEFTSIPQDGTDLVILASVRSDRAEVTDDASLKFNGSSANYSTRSLIGSGSVASSDNFAGITDRIGRFDFPATNYTSNTFGNFLVYIPNYSGSTAKSVSVDLVAENNGTEGVQRINAALWNDTAAITSILFDPIGNFVAGSIISLYKVTKGSDGIVTTS